MNTDWLIDLVGVAAGFCSMASFPPQIAKILREHDASSVSLRMFALTMSAFALWTTYGVLRGAWPLVASNGVCLLMASAIVVLRLRYGDGRPR